MTIAFDPHRYGRSDGAARRAEATGRDIAYTRVPPEDFADYARVTTATGVWNPTKQPNSGGPR